MGMIPSSAYAVTPRDPILHP